MKIIPHVCHFNYTHAFWDLKMLHPKVRYDEDWVPTLQYMQWRLIIGSCLCLRKKHELLTNFNYVLIQNMSVWPSYFFTLTQFPKFPEFFLSVSHSTFTSVGTGPTLMSSFCSAGLIIQPPEFNPTFGWIWYGLC